MTKLKKQEDTVWLKEVNSQAPQFALRSLDTAYVNFSRGNAQFPKFKSRKHKNTFTILQFGKIENSRLDRLNKVSYGLVKANQVLAIEGLNVKGLAKNRKVSKSIADASWANFVNLLQYKCDWYGRELVKVDRFYPSSKK